MSPRGRWRGSRCRSRSSARCTASGPTPATFPPPEPPMIRTLFARAVAVASALLLTAAGQVPSADWAMVGRTLDEQRFSPLTQINDRTVGRLGLAWFADIQTERGMEASPLEIGGVLYNVQPWNIVTAYDAVSGMVLWRFDPQVPTKYGRMACCDIVSRGLAAWHGKIYVATLDGRLIALDAKSGQPLWTVPTVDNS